MKHDKECTRKCSVVTALGAGAAICLTGGGARAAVVTGNIVNSNGKTLFNLGSNLKACNSLAGWRLSSFTGGSFAFSSGLAGGRLNFSGAYILPHGAGVVVSTAMANGFDDARRIPNGVADKYFAVRYNNLSGGVRYGWLHVNATTANTISLDKWGYENTGASIKTLGESVTAKKLGLADGTAKLLWSNANEDGIARYEAQTKDASGAWKTMSSDAPGAGSYSATVPAGAACRIVVEKVDGATEEIGF